MKSGFANIIKPPGLSSSDVVVRLRRMLPRGVRVGHMGTLDPAAQGVLPIGVGKAARLFDFMIEKDKEYIAEMALGAQTDTQDGEGQVVARADASGIGAQDIRRVMKAFTGEIQQIPPAYSAVKIGGERAYDLARRGEEVVLRSRTARIDGIELLSFHTGRALLRVRCGRGTYIRTLLHDMGAALGCGAYMAFLVRTRTGPFSIEQGMQLEDVARDIAQGGDPFAPMDVALGELYRIDLGKAQGGDVRNGRALPATLAAPLAQGGVARVYLAGQFAGIVDRQGDKLRWRAMLLEDEKA